MFDSADEQWREAAPVPGGVGRLAATAVAVGELAYVFGGYTVAEDGSEAVDALGACLRPAWRRI